MLSTDPERGDPTLDVPQPHPAGVSHSRLIGAAALMAVGNVLGRALGLVRDQVIAATFGATAQTDAYVVARVIPLILYDLLVGSVITAAFVPVFVQYARDQRQLWRLVSAVLTLAAIGLMGIAGLLSLFSYPIVHVLTGFPPAQQDLASGLMRIALISVVFQGMAGVLTSVLYARNRFLLPAFANATYNVGVIAGVLLLAHSIGIAAAATGLLLGGIGQFVVQGSGLLDFWRAFRPRLDLRDPAVRRVLTLAGTVSAGLVVTVIGQLIDTNLASRLPAGSLSAKQFATTLVQFPLGMVGLATSYAVLPTLSRFATGPETDIQRYRQTLVFGLKFILLLMLPALAGLVALAHPLVGVLFQRGAFQSQATDLTASIFLAFAPMLPLTGMDYLLINAFYARQNARTPVLVGVVGVLIYLVVALLLLRPLGIIGLALANAIQNSAHGLILLVLLTRALPELRLWQAMAPFLARVIPASAAMGGLVWLAFSVLAHVGRFPALVLCIGLGVVLYAGLIQVAGVPEARTATALIRARLGR